VVEVEAGESVLEGLTREVQEETGIMVSAWEGPVYEVVAEAPDMGWRMRVEVHRAVDFSGDLVVDDLDQIVIDAQWVATDACGPHLEECPVWVREPLSAWLVDRWGDQRSYRYRVEGPDRATMSVTRL
jgi:8-oxo-dGTP diphosphatase